MIHTDIHEKLKKMMEDELYQHSQGVADTAKALAARYGADGNKAYLAGLVHDYAKGFPAEVLFEMAQQLSIPLDRVSRTEKRLLHGPVAAALLPRELGITDREIISAVAYHTTGRPEMALLEKVVYLADFIEPGRAFPGVEKLRRTAMQSLEEALLAAVEETICSVLKRGLMLHPRSILFRNSLLDH